MRKFYVYVHTCPNGKRYVGVTAASKPEYRWGKDGEGYKGQLFGKAVRKYGWSNITHEVFEVESKEEMYRKEVELISFYHSNDPEYGYNTSAGGECSALGCIRSEEFRRKLSEANKGKVLSKETRKRIAEANKGKVLSKETRKRIAESKKGKSNPHSEEHKRHISESHKGKPQPKVKISLPDGTIIEISKQNLSRHYIKKGKAFEYVS